MSKDLEHRLDRIEKALIAAGLMKPDLVAGADITNADWIPRISVGGASGWEVAFEFRCEQCNEVHSGQAQIPANAKDGGFYTVKGACGKSSLLRIWKDVSNRDNS